jgi:hypothetical protein
MGDPQSLHKYAYCHDNPVMGIDPTGMFSLVEMVVTNAVQNILFSMIGEVLSPILKEFSGMLIPQFIKNAIMSLDSPSAISLAVSGTAGKVISGTGGADILWSPHTNNAAMYVFSGISFSASSGVSVSASLGYVYQCPTSNDYQGPFGTISLPTTSSLPISNKTNALGISATAYEQQLPYQHSVPFENGVQEGKITPLYEVFKKYLSFLP